MTADQLPTEHQPLPVPGTLGAAGEVLWLDLSGHYALDPGETALLLAACQLADNLAAMAATIAEDGAMDSSGRPHPAVVEHRLLTQQLGRAVAQLTPKDDKADREPRRYGYWAARRPLGPA